MTKKTNGGTNGYDDALNFTTKIYRLGRASAFGLDGETLDPAKGNALLEEAALSGILGAHGELAFSLWLRADGARDKKRAFELAEEPAKAGDPFAMFVASALLKAGAEGIEKDEKRASTLKLEAWRGLCFRAKDDALAARTLGFFFREELEVEISSAFEVRRFNATEEAARAEADGRAYSTCVLGCRYLGGLGVEKNEDEGIRLIRRAAESDFPPAMNVFGDCWADGKGVARDAERAIFWYRRAAESKSATAAIRRRAVERWQKLSARK